MDKKQRNCMIGQSGGPTAAINASLAGVISKAIESKEFSHVYGMIHGVEGLLQNKYIELTNTFSKEDMIQKLVHTPAMYLGSCRYKLPALPDDMNEGSTIEEYEILFKRFEELNITDFFYIGGNDSMDTVMKLSQYAKHHHSDIRFLGVPKTIDNDLYGTDHTPGFGSAAKYVATSMLEIIHDSMIYDTKSVTIVEIMGRNAGWLTAAAALARTNTQVAPDLIYLPEVVFDKEKFLHSIEELFKTRRNIIVAVSEGVRDKHGNFLDNDTTSTVKCDVFGHALHSGTGKVLENMVSTTFGCKTRSIELNVLQRCAMHIASQTDLLESFAVGSAAVTAALEGKSAVMMTMHRHQTSDGTYQIKTSAEDIKNVANIEKKVPLPWINASGDDITKEMYDYLYPLIQGEVQISYKNGVPDYLDIRHIL